MFINLPISFTIALFILFSASKLLKIEVSTSDIGFVISGLILITAAIVYKFYVNLREESQAKKTE